MEEHIDISSCPVRRGLCVFEGKWNSRVLYELIARGTMRFGELRRAVPECSNTMLASTLKELERMGLVRRTQYSEIPPHVEYSLTESGQGFASVFEAIGAWAQRYAAKS